MSVEELGTWEHYPGNVHFIPCDENHELHACEFTMVIFHAFNQITLLQTAVPQTLDLEQNNISNKAASGKSRLRPSMTIPGAFGCLRKASLSSKPWLCATQLWDSPFDCEAQLWCFGSQAHVLGTVSNSKMGTISLLLDATRWLSPLDMKALTFTSLRLS